MYLRNFILVAGLMWASSISAIEVAGKTMVTKGKVRATSETAQERKLRRRAPIYDNDVVTTGKAAKAQIRMSDGGMIALKENSELIIADYEYSEGDGQGSVVMELVKGGLRSVTGAIKADTGDYKLKTPVGSIGIRGTHYELEMVGTELFIAVWDGAIDVSVDTGAQAGETLSFGQGEDYSYASIDEEGNVTEFLEPPENFESGMSSETDDSEANSDEEEAESEESESEGTSSEQSSSEQSEESSEEQSEESSEEQSEESSEEQSEESSEEQSEESSEEQSEQQASSEAEQEEQDSQQESQQSQEQQQESQEQQEQPAETSQEQSTSTAGESDSAAAEVGQSDTAVATGQEVATVTTTAADTPEVSPEQGSLDSSLGSETLVESSLDQDAVFEPIGEVAAQEVVPLVPEEETFPTTDDFDGGDPTPIEDLISQQTGTLTYNKLSSVDAGDDIENFRVFMEIDFQTLGVTAGDLTFDDAQGQWRGSFSGRITGGGDFDLKFNHASHGNNLADGIIGAKFIEGIDSIDGNFTLHEVLNTNITSGGSFRIRR